MRCPNCGYSTVQPHRYVCDNFGLSRHYTCWRCHYSWQTVKPHWELMQQQVIDAALSQITANDEGAQS